jgi:hypothetical protein
MSVKYLKERAMKAAVEIEVASAVGANTKSIANIIYEAFYEMEQLELKKRSCVPSFSTSA